MANSAYPDGTARYEPSHLDLHCLQRYMYWSAGMPSVPKRALANSLDPDQTPQKAASNQVLECLQCLQ